jgi:hypothetical protein
MIDSAIDWVIDRTEGLMVTGVIALVAIFSCLAALVLYAIWIAAGYLLDILAFPATGRWGLQLVITLLIIAILKLIDRIARQPEPEAAS